MKPEELMIGDILEYMGTIVKVYSIGAKICVKECFGKNTYIVDSDNLLKGLKLTLEKNGFENDFYHDESVADYHFVRLEGYSYREDFILVTWCNGELNVVNDLIGEVKIHCENVHELQHALRLCGIDKEIEI